MSGRNIEDFFQNPEAFDALSDEDRARLFAGETLEGETKVADPENTDVAAEENSESPAAVEADPEASDQSTVVEPVVLAKDGQHTIPFSELEAARERARQLEQQLLAIQTKPADQQPATEKSPDANLEQTESNEDKLLRLRREEREAMYATDTELAEKLGKEADALNRQIAKDEMRSENAKQAAERKAQETQDSALSEALARADAMADKYLFLKPGLPTTNQVAIDGVVAERDRLMAKGIPFAEAIEQAVEKVAPMFNSGSATQQTSADVAAKAAEAISKAKAKVPTSLSQAPAGSAVHHDEGEAIRAMSINSLSRSLESKSPEEIMKIMAKVL